MLHLAHIINPVKVSSSSDLYTAQPITFESMRIARQKVANLIKVDLYTTQYAEDHPIIPPYFIKLPDLQRAVTDVYSFKKKRKLPLIQDILDQLYHHSKAEYFIYTNVDIGLMPNFYLKVKTFIDQNHDAFIINRRRISEKYQDIEELPQIYQDLGKPHPGFDCFIFHRNLYPMMRFDHICVGIPFIGVCFAHNLFCFAQNFKLFDQVHLTFHIGMAVLPKRDKEYYWYNRRAFNHIKRTYFWERFDIQKFPYSELPFWHRYIKWGLNPSLFILMNLRLEWKQWLATKKVL